MANDSINCNTEMGTVFRVYDLFPELFEVFQIKSNQINFYLLLDNIQRYIG